MELSYCPGRAPFLESMPSLLQAIVRFDDACEDKCQKSVSGGCDDDDDDYCFGCADEVVAGYGTNGMCLQGLSEATHLELSADPAVVCILETTSLISFLIFFLFLLFLMQ